MNKWKRHFEAHKKCDFIVASDKKNLQLFRTRTEVRWSKCKYECGKDLFSSLKYHSLQCCCCKAYEWKWNFFLVHKVRGKLFIRLPAWDLHRRGFCVFIHSSVHSIPFLIFPLISLHLICHSECGLCITFKIQRILFLAIRMLL
jgi:hypothetical protein